MLPTHIRILLVGYLSIAIACQGSLTVSANYPRVLLSENFDLDHSRLAASQWNTDVPSDVSWSMSISSTDDATALQVVMKNPADHTVRLFRSVDSVSARGMRATVTARARLGEGSAGRAELSVSSIRSGSTKSAWDEGRASTSKAGVWTELVATIDIPLDSYEIDVSLIAAEASEATFDDIKLIVNAPSPPILQQLGGMQISQLQTLITALGYLRFFYPSDSAFAANWQLVELRAVLDFLTTVTARDFPRWLETLVHSLAPQAHVYATGQRPIRVMPVPGAALTRVVRLGLGDEEPFSAFRTGLNEPINTGLRVSFRIPLAGALSCRTATAKLNLESRSDFSHVQLDLMPLGTRGTSPETVAVQGSLASLDVGVPSGARYVEMGLFVHGIGDLIILGLELQCDHKLIRKISVETVPSVDGLANHLYVLSRDQPCGVNRCFRIYRATETSPTSSDIANVEIGSSLSLQIPLVLPVQNGRTLPIQSTTTESTRLPPGDMVTRITSALDLWLVLSWFYPYFSDLRIDWNAALAPALNLATSARSDDSQKLALSSLTSALRDDHARVIRPGIDDGLLPLLFRSFGDQIVVTASLSEFTSIPVGSTLLTVDGVPAAEARRRAAASISSATSVWKDRQSAYAIAYGHRGAVSWVEYRDAHTSQVVVQPVAHLDRARFASRLREARPSSGTEVASGVFYVDLHALDLPAWQSILPELELARAVIFDLRGYVGPAAFTTLAHLTQREIRSPILLTPIVSPLRPQRYEDASWYISPKLPALRGKFFFLADARTASAPETILQFVRGAHLGSVVGEPSGGTNGNVVNYATLDGMNIRFTGLRALNQDGTAIQGQGITPDFVVHPTVRGVADGRDEILDAAVVLASSTN